MGTVAQPPDTGLQEALRCVPERLRITLLHHLDGYSVPEIAKMLRLPESAVRGRLYEGRKRLKALLEEAKS